MNEDESVLDRVLMWSLAFTYRCRWTASTIQRMAHAIWGLFPLSLNWMETLNISTGQQLSSGSFFILWNPNVIAVFTKAYLCLEPYDSRLILIKVFHPQLDVPYGVFSLEFPIKFRMNFSFCSLRHAQLFLFDPLLYKHLMKGTNYEAPYYVVWVSCTTVLLRRVMFLLGQCSFC